MYNIYWLLLHGAVVLFKYAIGDLCLQHLQGRNLEPGDNPLLFMIDPKGSFNCQHHRQCYTILHVYIVTEPPQSSIELATFGLAGGHITNWATELLCSFHCAQITMHWFFCAFICTDLNS